MNMLKKAILREFKVAARRARGRRRVPSSPAALSLRDGDAVEEGHRQEVTAKVARISKEQSTAGGEVGHADDFQWALAMVAGRKTAP